MQRRAGLAAVGLGVVAQLSGLAVDAVLHARDASLVAREGVFALTNPGHLLLALGLALSVTGVCLLLLPRVSRERRGRARTWMAALPAAMVLVLAAATFAIAARGSALTGHDHTRTNTGVAAPANAASLPHLHDATGAALAPTGTVATAPNDATQRLGLAQTDGSRRQNGDDVNVTWEQIQAASTTLTTTRAATGKYRDVNVARADGYIQVTQVVPGLGAHFIQPRLMAAGKLDPERPDILLYDRTADGGFELVGVAWSLPKKQGDDTAPTSPFGPLAVFHYHTDLCFGARAGGPVVSATTASGCRAAGGIFVKETPWMIHAWVFRPSPEGIFSHENSSITGDIAAGRQ